jgi:hypothetical protein
MDDSMGGRWEIASIFTVVASFLSCAGASAQEVTVRWVTEDGGVIMRETLDLQEIEALPQAEIVTTTPWTDGVQTFTGPSLGDIAALAGRPVVEAEVTALNDYSATIPADDWEERGAILAARQGGETMRIRDKGPYWVMYPIDSDPELNTQFYHARMVWQVSDIDFIVE